MLDETRRFSVTNQRDFWKSEADSYRELYRKEMERRKDWRIWSMWWCGLAVFSIIAFWLEVWRHQRG